MKLSILGIHQIIQTLEVQGSSFESFNTILTSNTTHETVLSDLAIMLNQKHDVSLIANFSPNPLSMRLLATLEKHEVDLHPVLLDEDIESTLIKNEEREFLFSSNPILKLNDFHLQGYIASEYIITNQSNFELLAKLKENSSARIIAIDSLPMFRSLEFIEGLVLHERPAIDIHMLIQSGLKWIAIIDDNQTQFCTQNLDIILDIESSLDFINQFLLAIEENNLSKWLLAHSMKK